MADHAQKFTGYICHMKLLFVAATEKEITPLLRSFKATKTNNKLFSFCCGKNQVDVLVTGAGIALTIYHLTKLLNVSRYRLVINVGIAGIFRKHLQPGTVVNVISDCFADFGAENGEGLLTAEEIKLVSRNEYNVRASHFRNKMTDVLPAVNGITVNKVHGNERSIKKVKRKFNPDTESMEGAAFFLVCNKEKIPCIQLRAISNYVKRRNREKWKTKLAISRLNIFLQIFLQHL